MRRFPARAAGLTLLLACCTAAQAQVSGSLSLATDYRYRGYSLSNGKPVAKLLLAYDARSGSYGGVEARVPREGIGGQPGVDLLGYGGYSRRVAGDLVLDMGAAVYTYSAASHANYKEVYLGVSTDRFSTRMSYGPNYLGFGGHTLYLQVEASYPLGGDVSLFAHAGHMHMLGRPLVYGQRSLTDARVGVGLAAGDWNLQLALDAADTGAYDGYRVAAFTRAARSNLMLIATRPF